MSFKTFATGAAIAGALVSSTVVTAAPAEAAAISVGSTIQFSSLPLVGRVSFNETTGNLDFAPQTAGVGIGTGSFARVGPFARVEDLTLVNDGGGIFSLASTQTNFIRNINLPPVLSGFNDVQFSLTKFILDSNTGNSTVLKGFFTKDGQTTQAVGRFTSQIDFVDSSTWSMSIRAVPTPALLPGLIGMGVAALRRKDEESAEENA